MMPLRFMFTASLLTLVVVYILYELEDPSKSFTLERFINYTLSYSTLPKNADSSVVEPCDFPKLDPFDPTILKYYRLREPLVCHRVQPQLFHFQNNRYVWNQAAFDEGYFNFSLADVACRYIFQVHNSEKRRFEKFVRWNTFNVTNGFAAVSDVASVQCSNDSFKTLFFQEEFLHVIPTNKTSEEPASNRHSIFMVMVDALSRSNFVRQLPQTFAYLTQELEAVEFRRHVKVGENTEPNMLGLLLGVAKERAQEAGAPNKKGPFDEWPLLFYELRKMGYVTSMIEDWGSTSLFVQYGLKGFRKKPFTHYPRLFWRRALGSKLRKKSVGGCYNEKPFHNISFDYGLELWRKYPKTSKFLIAMMETLTHDALNMGSRADGDYLAFLKQFEHHLKDTFLVIFSDHGIRYSSIRGTPIGRLESSIPALFIVPPRCFRYKHPGLFQRLANNTEVGLTTVFDLHQTLRQIAHRFREVDRKNLSTGISLFSSIPRDRSCQDAGIPETFCVCQKVRPVPTTAPWVEKAADALLSRVAAILQPFPACANLSLHNVTSAMVKLLDTDNVTNLKPGRHFERAVITIYVVPSFALLQADAVYAKKGKRFSFVVDGVIQRLNMYGNQPHCITEDHVRKLCYCKDLLDVDQEKKPTKVKKITTKTATKKKEKQKAKMKKKVKTKKNKKIKIEKKKKKAKG